MKQLPSVNPPGNIPVEKTPLFVTMGFDDNGHSGYVDESKIEGMRWASEFFASLKNPEGSGNEQTFDGEQGSITFYHASKYIHEDKYDEPTELVRKSWYEAVQAGHEVGCHTRSHSCGSEFSAEQWKEEMQLCIDDLTADYSEEKGNYGIGVLRDQIPGFRTPFLAYSEATFQSAKDMGFRYDCSIEEGGQPDQDGTNYLWPYTMDEGSPGNKYTHEEEETPLIAPVEGLWEMPCHMVICPPDELCEEYGIEPGFRDRMFDKQPEYFESENGKITGLDYNCLVEFAMTPAEWLGTLKYTFDLRLKGNRAPFTFGGHTDVYAEGYDICPNITIAERRETLEAFFHYALSHDEVRVVSYDKIIDWMENPVALG